MNINTITKLNTAATDMTNSFIEEYNMGHLTDDIIKSDFNSLGDKKTDLEFIKKTIRVDHEIIKQVWADKFNLNLSNVMKTTQQFNYLANEILAGLKRKAPKSLKANIVG